MARPKGSTNKKNTPVQTTTASGKDPFQAAFGTYEAHFTEGTETITSIMATLAEEFEALRDLAPSRNGTSAPAPSAKAPASKKAPAKAEPEEPPNFDEMDADELQEFIDKHELAVDLDDFKTMSKKRLAVEEAYELETVGTGGDEGEEGSGEGPPDFDEMSREALQEFIEDNNLDVDLDDYQGMSKKRAAVEEAYEAENAPAPTSSGKGKTKSDEDW